MSSAPIRPQRDFDAFLAGGALVAAAVALLLLWTDARGDDEAPSTQAIGAVSSATADIRRRADGTLVWRNIGSGAPLHPNDSIFVPPGATATLSLSEGTELDVEENSLLVLEDLEETGSARPTVSLMQGSLAGQSGERGLSIKGGGGIVDLDKNSRALLDTEGEQSTVAVTDGTATVRAGAQKVALGRDEVRGVADGKVIATPAMAIRLVAPARNARVFFQDALPDVSLEFTLDGAGPGSRLQVSRGRTFSAPIASVEPRSPYRFRPPGAGVFWWRVVDPAGRPISEARPFSVVQQLPPAQVSPLPGENVDVSTVGAVPFAWSRVPSSARYLVQVSSDPRFASSVHEQEVEGTQYRMTASLAEGTYHWRVRAVASDGAPPWSASASFRLLLKPLLAAPELIAPELEVESEQREP